MDQTLRRSDILYAAIAFLGLIANIIAFCFQFFYYELPCPLCLLQRFGFIAIGLGATLSLKNGPSWKYDIIIILSSIYTLAVGFRQVLLHIVPHDKGYGSSFLGLHFYTWAAVLSFSLIILMAILPTLTLAISKYNIPKYSPKFIVTLIEISFILITLLNMVACFFECGFGLCPSDPTTYLELQKSV